uniref:Uncharacterized protein n=1 Tax=Anopheles dirus TaxID=7168 RepID=A0A182NW54_9DIPT
MMQFPHSRMRIFSSKIEALNFYREGSDDEDKVTQEDQEFKIKYYVVFGVQVTRDRLINLFYHDMAGARAVMMSYPDAKLKTFSSKEDALQFYHEGSADDEADETEGSGGL